MMGSGGKGRRREGAAEEGGERGDLVRKKKILIRGVIGRRGEWEPTQNGVQGK